MGRWSFYFFFLGLVRGGGAVEGERGCERKRKKKKKGKGVRYFIFLFNIT